GQIQLVHWSLGDFLADFRALDSGQARLFSMDLVELNENIKRGENTPCRGLSGFAGCFMRLVRGSSTRCGVLGKGEKAWVVCVYCSGHCKRGLALCHAARCG